MGDLEHISSGSIKNIILIIVILISNTIIGLSMFIQILWPHKMLGPKCSLPWVDYDYRAPNFLPVKAPPLWFSRGYFHPLFKNLEEKLAIHTHTHDWMTIIQMCLGRTAIICFFCQCRFLEICWSDDKLFFSSSMEAETSESKLTQWQNISYNWEYFKIFIIYTQTVKLKVIYILLYILM